MALFLFMSFCLTCSIHFFLSQILCLSDSILFVSVFLPLFFVVLFFVIPDSVFLCMLFWFRISAFWRSVSFCLSLSTLTVFGVVI